MTASPNSRFSAPSEELAAARLKLPRLDEQTYLLSGLSSEDVLLRKSLSLTNSVDTSSSRRWGEILRSNLLTLFNLVVGGAFLLLLLLGQWQDALFGFAVVSNVLIGVLQEYRSKRTLDRLALLTEPRARVLRAGDIEEIPLEGVVLDDLLQLRAGDQIIADSLLVAGEDLEVDESLLTGESEPILKQRGDPLLSGSIVLGGSGSARVVRIGAETYASRISLAARRFSLVNSELRNALQRIIRWISIALLPMMLIAVNGQFQAVGGVEVAIREGTWLEAAVKSIASIISMVPQGLVLITSISFAIAALKLARNRVLVQELPAVEGLARVDVVCFDKTGTLTEGELEFVELDSIANSSKSRIDAILASFAWDDAANATALALRASLPKSSALAPIAAESFNSSRRWASITVAAGSGPADDGQSLKLIEGAELWLLGAPEVLIAAHPPNNLLLARAQALAESGNRILTLARAEAELSQDQKLLPKAFEPVCLLVFRERIRPDAQETLEYFARQGVEIRVISGDNPATVLAVARRAGLQDAAAIDGSTLPEEELELGSVLAQHRVFGRITPEQKLAMVKALQLNGRVVAMTGDGVNDALALKQADLGIAMGNAASATKAVSRIVLLESQFSSLPGVVGEGRKVIANVERVSRLFLTKTVWAMSLALVFGILLWAFPFLPRQLSAVDGYTIGIPAFFLALLANETRYRPGFLRRALAFCIPSGLVVALSIVLLNLLIRPESGLHLYESVSLPEAQTATAILMSIVGLWVLATLTRPMTGRRLVILASMVLVAIAVFVIPTIAGFFGFVALQADLLTLTFFVALAACSLLEVVHQSVSRWARTESLLS